MILYMQLDCAEATFLFIGKCQKCKQTAEKKSNNSKQKSLAIMPDKLKLILALDTILDYCILRYKYAVRVKVWPNLALSMSQVYFV